MEASILLVLLSCQHFFRSTTDAANAARDNEISEKNVSMLDLEIKRVMAQTNGTAVLPCKITGLGSGIVTWVRKKDRHLLTVGRETYSMDNRFMVRPSVTDWTLIIKNVRHDDAGLYECQIPSEPMEHRYVRLNITEAFSIIPGAPDLHVKEGSSLRLECQLISATEPPIFVFWYRQGRMINYDADPSLKVAATRNGSTLVVEKTQPSHGGNYTCQPSNAKSAYVMIHVIEEEEKPAAMHGGDRPNSSPSLRTNILLFMFVVVIGVNSMRRYTRVSISSANIITESDSRSNSCCCSNDNAASTTTSSCSTT